MLGVSAALGVWVLHQGGWLAAWDGVFYDQFLSITARWRNPEPKVLLLRLAREDVWSDAEAFNTLNVMDDLGARAIVFSFLPTRNSREFFQRAAELDTVVFGRELRPAPNNPDALRPDSWPAAARDLNLPWGVVSLPPSLKGVYRRQQASITAGEDTFPTLESRVATLCVSNVSRLPEVGTFLVNFVGGPGSIPNASLSQALAGELIPEVVEGRVVLIGRDDGLFGLETPVCRGTETMGFLEFQGNALQTLLDGTPIRAFPWAWTLAFLVGLGLVSSLLYQRVNSVAGARLVLGVLLVSALGAFAGLWFFRLWVPLGAVVLAQTSQFGLTLVFKTRMTNRALHEMRLHVLNQIKERYCPQELWRSAEYWDHLALMISQTLEVRRMVFLERIPQTQRLLEVKAVHCTFDDLQERDLTLEAPAFSLALAKGSPFRATGMLRDGAAPEVEYLCPLAFAGEVLGMWIVGIAPEKTAAAPQLEADLMKFSLQIGRLMYHKRRAALKQSLPARLKTWFSAEKEDQAYRQLRNTADMLEQYYDVLETVLSQVGTAMVVYDFFGNVLKANEPALALLRAEQLAPARATVVDFLQLVTGQDALQVRTVLRNVLLESSPVSLSVKLTSQKDRQYLLRVYPLPERRQLRSGQEPLSVRGIICELIETTSLSTLASVKGVVADRLGVELRDHLAAIEMSAALLEMDSLSGAERGSVLDAIHHKTRTCVQVIRECQKYLGRNVDAHGIDCFPLDALEVLGQVCSVIAPKAAERNIALQVEQPRLMDQVLASTSDLEQLFSTSLELLLRDAAENTALTIEVEDVSDRSIFRFSNCGFGIPNERLQQVLTSPEIPASDEFRALREALVAVGNWGGSLEISSEVGRGYSIVLQLRQFKLTSLLLSQLV